MLGVGWVVDGVMCDRREGDTSTCIPSISASRAMDGEAGAHLTGCQTSAGCVNNDLGAGRVSVTPCTADRRDA